MPYSTIARIAIPEIGGVLGSVFGNDRSSKRDARKQYRNALIGAGVRSSLVDPWHSDEHEAGKTLLQIAQRPQGVQFLNQNMPSRITRNSVSVLHGRYQSWFDAKNTSPGTPNSPGANGPSSAIGKLFPVLAGLGGLIYWGTK